jgi:hypothetical protein
MLFATYLNWPAALLLFAGGLATAFILANTAKGGVEDWLAKPVDLPVFSLCVAAGLALVILGGEAHLFFANSDWLIRDAVLADLSRGHTLPSYSIGGATYIMRAPLGMYMIPALAGQAIGLKVAHLALVAQNGALFGAIIYGFLQLLPKPRGLAIVAMLCVSGLDLLGWLLVSIEAHHPVSWGALPSHLDYWSLYWQYSSQITQIFWVPNHALPGWWAALLALLCARGEISLGWFGLSLATCFFWSPLAAAGAVPFLLLYFARDPLLNLVRPSFWLQVSASLLFLPEMIYMIISGDTINHGLENRPAFLLLYPQFLILALTPTLLLVLFIEKFPRGVAQSIYLSISVLIVLPFFQFGPGNDLVMRASIPSLLILAYGFGCLASWGPFGRPALWATSMALGVFSAASPIFEVVRALIFPAYQISDCSLVSAQMNLSPSPVAANYMAIASAAPRWIVIPPPAPAAVQPRANCWPDFPFNPRMYVGFYSNSRLQQSKPNAISQGVHVGGVAGSSREGR